ncbi:MAG: aspartyl protease family protein [Chryseotalea sp. WA131a]|nr:MAG: aspartyl protease family protein [Chryseotalea sp. WA131a]
MACKPSDNLLTRLVGKYLHNEWFFSFKSGNETTTIPFEVINGWIIIKVKIGKEEHRFLFDTGASTSIEPEITNELFLPSIRDFTTIDANGIDRKVPLVYIPKLTLGNRTFTHIGAFSTSHQSTKCIGVKGVIGHNLLYGSVWKINFQDKTITISQQTDKSSFNLEKFNLIKIKTDWKKMMYLRLTTDRGQIDAVLDTGLPNYILINKKFINHFNKTDLVKKKINYIGSANSSLIDTISMYKANNIRLSDIPIDKDILIFSNLESSVGCGFLSYFQEIVINLREKRLLLSKNELSKVERKPVNINISWKDGVTRVTGLAINSKMEKAGLKTGDQIISINCISTDLFQNACEYKAFESTMDIYKSDIELSILRDGQKYNYTFSKDMMYE